MIRFRLLTAREKEELKVEKLTSWHKWFAWKPVRLTYDKHEVRWLGFVLRKGRCRGHDEGVYWDWKYAETEFDILKIEDK